MVFSSLVFMLVFLPVTLALYYLSPRKIRNLILLAASLVFYGWGEPVYISIMIFSTVFDYFNGILIEGVREKRWAARAVFINSIVVNLAILGFFKYYPFIVENLNFLLGTSIKVVNLPLPVGISFYTFQTMSYTIDVYLGKVKAQRNIISFGAYVTMFPQLVAGPIVRYCDIAEQLDNSRRESISSFGEGAELFIAGLGKKVLLGNNIGLLWSSIKATTLTELSVLSAWLGIMAFTLQIYFDFSGYSDMARGLGKMFGFDFMENFDYPYISRSVTEFWRRWHISLSSWFKEYLYIPLGGNKRGRLNQFRNIFIVWLATGFWHGANWNFILWGLYYGIFLIIEKTFLLKWLKERSAFLGHFYTLFVVIIGWVLFEFENLSQCIGYIGVMFGFGGRGVLDTQALYYLYTNGVLFIILALCATPVVSRCFTALKNRLKLAGIAVVPVIYMLILVISTAYLVNESYNPFLYFRF